MTEGTARAPVDPVAGGEAPCGPGGRPIRARPDDLALYVSSGCGYCEDVRVEAGALGLTLEERDTSSDLAHRADLFDALGRRTVPVLRIRGEDGDEWMGESTRIIEYLHERFGDGTRSTRSWRRWASHRATTVAMWGLLLGGGISPEPARSALWTAACSLAAARSFTLAVHSRIATIHWAVGAAFATGAVSIPLNAAGVIDFPWWYVALAAAGFAAVVTWVRSRRARSARADP